MSNFICHACLFLCALFALQRGKAGPRRLKPRQNGGHADSTATQPGGHRNAKSTSKSTHKHTHGLVRAHTQVLAVLFTPTDTNTHPHAGPPAAELAQKKKLSCVLLQTHARPLHIHFLFLR